MEEQIFEERKKRWILLQKGEEGRMMANEAEENS